ncbi:MAG: DUF4982 domain-containing protein [Treponema sp.]|jgi:beta-galactosidase|nr:DUF4982 domain-containing protein [Treponema sp.]
MKREQFNAGWILQEKSTMITGIGGDKKTKSVHLPHDLMIEQKRRPDIPNGKRKGFFPDGHYEYVKRFTLGKEYAEKRITFEFEGVYMNAEVFINGEFAGGRPYGYSNFYIDANRFLKFGEENSITVAGETSDDSRWYSGAGIYRNVFLIAGERIHFALDGVKITTADIGADYAVMNIESVVANETASPQDAVVVTELFDPRGKIVASDTVPVSLLESQIKVRGRLFVKNPQLWDVDSPNLYTVRSSIRSDNTVLDTEDNHFGIRKLSLDVEHGLMINGKTVKLRGACIHHDNGVIGAATFERAEERRAELLKAAGFNAIRSDPTPISKALLDACDRLGLLVLDETFDMWTIRKTLSDYSRYFPQWWEQDVESMVAKDYNHPCVILYSIGNEIPDTGTKNGTLWGRKLAEKIRSLDGSRFIAICINGMVSVMEKLAMQSEQNKPAEINSMMTDMGDMMKQAQMSDLVTQATAEAFSCVDVAGYNYMDCRYVSDHELFPNRIILGSETFPRDIAANWKLVESYGHVIGDFTWAGWDYLGEVGIGEVRYDGNTSFNGEYPWHIAWCGDFDITGNRRPISFYRETVWGFRKNPYIAVLNPEHYGKKPCVTPWGWSDSIGSWTWPGYEGKPITLEVYSAADEVALLFDGVLLDKKPAGKANNFLTVFNTIYRPGKLEAVAYTAGVESGRFALVSAAPEVELVLATDRTLLKGGIGDLAYLTISLADRNGNNNPSVEKKITVTVKGAGVLQGLGSGNPKSEEDYFATECTTFYGKALAVIRPLDEPGKIEVTVQAPGCSPKSLSLTVN